MSSYTIQIKPFGAHAVLIEWPKRVEDAILDDVLEFEQHLKNYCLDTNNWELVPSYNSITLIQRNQIIEHKTLIPQLKKWYRAKRSGVRKEKYLWRLPVCYDSNFGLDLQEVSDKLNKSTSEIIEKHTSHVYTVYGIGFLPGFMYLGGLPADLNVPRRSTPRLNVPQGSVGLAGVQTGIYPQTSPGGWNIIGRCSVELFNPKHTQPCFVNVGDKVQFYSIERAEYDLYKIETEVGVYQLKKTIWNA